MDMQTFYTVPWVPGLVQQFESWQLREMLDCASVVREQGISFDEARYIAANALVHRRNEQDQRFGMLIGCCIEMGMITR